MSMQLPMSPSQCEIIGGSVILRGKQKGMWEKLPVAIFVSWSLLKG